MKPIFFAPFFLIVLNIFSLCPAFCQPDVFDDIELSGRFDHWVVRRIEESAVIGGKTALLYEPALKDGVLEGRRAYSNPPGCVWRTSNAYADVMGVVKTSTSVFPEKRGDGYCARLEVLMAEVKVLGLLNMDVVCQGSLFLGRMIEPIKDTKNPQSKLLFGVPVGRRPSALQLDYKAVVGGEAIYAPGLGRVRKLGYRDYADLVVMLQYRWEDKDGNVYAKRVGTGYERIFSSVREWQNGHQVPIWYGDITGLPQYRPYMGLIEERVSNYTLNSRGELVPVHEVGWADADTVPNYLIVRFSSSYGEAFNGAVGNKLWIDNVKFVF